MILPFSQSFKNRNKTRFAEKIWCCIDQHHDKMLFDKFIKTSNTLLELQEFRFGKNDCEFSAAIFKSVLPKMHTIREDKKDRWNSGKLIHCAYNNRSSGMYIFAPVFICISTQEIKIRYEKGKSEVSEFL